MIAKRHPNDIRAIVTRWNPSTWWGTATSTDEMPPRSFEFHGTCVRGMRGGFVFLGREVLVVLNGSGELLSVEVP